MKFPRPVLLLLVPGLVASLPHGAAAAADAPDPEAYRRHALTHTGDIERGKALFQDSRLLCSACHTVDGSAGKAGPDLLSAGDAFGRRDLIESVLRPSATISPGYGALFVEKHDGTAYQGTLKGKTETETRLMGTDGKLVTIPAAEIKTEAGLPVSLMPEGLYANISQRDFTDLVEYLTSLKLPDSALVSDHGMPAEIPELARPVIPRPFFAKDRTLPRGKAESGLTAFHQLPGDPSVFFILHQTGVIWRVEKSASGEEREEIFVDLPTEVFSERGPNGMLDMTFHPKFRENRKYYLFYQVFEDGRVTTHIVEREMDAAFRKDSGKAPRLILKIGSVAEDHSGGCLLFGPDGYLYIVMGDTGPHNDPNGHAQNLGLLLGKMLRVDVDRQDPGLAYAIPADNPFVGQADARPEIWAYGLRNPWRFCFDRLNGDLWLADVGQDRVEEVAIIRRGENHGWNIYEGYEPFSNQYRKEGRVFTKPVFAYRHKYGNSITGGYVCRSVGNDSFEGVYVFGDYNSKILFGITVEDRKLKKARRLGTLPQRIVSFGQDETGTIYAVGYEGMIYKLDFTDTRFE